MHQTVEQLTQAMLWPVIGITVGLIILIVIFLWARASFRDNEDSTVSSHRMLADCREMLLRGELTEEEYRLIKGRLSARIKEPPGRRSNSQKEERTGLVPAAEMAAALPPDVQPPPPEESWEAPAPDRATEVQDLLSNSQSDGTGVQPSAFDGGPPMDSDSCSMSE